MRTSVKRQLKRLLSFCIAFAMVIASVIVAPQTANAEEQKATTVKLYFKLPADTTASDWGFNYWAYENLNIISAGEEAIVGGTWGDQKKPVLLADENVPGFGYVEVSYNDTLAGMQFVRMLGEAGDENPTAYNCWNSDIQTQGLSAAYFNPEDEKWYTDAALSKTVSNVQTQLKLYYYILEESEESASEYGVNVWGGAALSEAGPKMTVTAWNNQQYGSLIATDMTNTIDGLDGTWAYVGLDSNAIEGIQFVTATGGDNVWNSEIKAQGLTEAYYIPGYGWFKDNAGKEEIKKPELRTDAMYIVGEGSALGNWNLEDAVAMEKSGEAEYTVTISMTAGTYIYTPVQDPEQFGWEHQYKDYENDWGNYSVTLEKDGDVVFTVKNPDPTTGKAEVTATVVEDTPEQPEDPKNDDSKKDDVKTDPSKPEVTTYTVTFKDGDKVLKTEKVESGKAATAPALPTKKGYTASWSQSVSKITSNVTVTVKWTKVAKPGKVTIKSAKNASKKTLKLSLKKVKGADGYVVRYATKKSMKGAKKVTAANNTLSVKKLKKGKTYYVQAKAYKLDSTGAKVYSSKWSTVKKVKIKK